MVSRRFLLIFILCSVMAGTAASLVVREYRSTDQGLQVINPFLKESLAQIVQGRAGKPFVLAFWSFNCGICVREMEVWRRVSDDYPDFDLVLVTTDPIDSEARINQVLKQEGMEKFESWAFADPISARLRSVVDLKWRGELPRIHFYDSDGILKVHMGMAKQEEVASWLEFQRKLGPENQKQES